MTGLAIYRGCGMFTLVSSESVGYGSGAISLAEAHIPFRAFSTRPDPIQRAWWAVQAKRAMRGAL